MDKKLVVGQFNDSFVPVMMVTNVVTHILQEIRRML